MEKGSAEWRILVTGLLNWIGCNSRLSINYRSVSVETRTDQTSLLIKCESVYANYASGRERENRALCEREGSFTFWIEDQKKKKVAVLMCCC